MIDWVRNGPFLRATFADIDMIISFIFSQIGVFTGVKKSYAPTLLCMTRSRDVINVHGESVQNRLLNL